MSYQPLHHKYRPQTFAQLVGQEAIATTLTNALRQQRIAPAYLFTGARGTGKTSSARIFAKSLNCIAVNAPTDAPCGVCETCRAITNGSALDVIEIDAASNTGVDNIRELIERAQFAPVQCRYKVYVIDECLTGDTLVETSEGLVRIDDANLKGKQVLSYSDESGKWEYKKVLKWLDQGERQTLVIKTTRREIRCTGNHLIRTDTGWIAAKSLKEGVKILSPVNVAVAPPYTNMERMEEPADFPQVINLRETLTVRKNRYQTSNLFQSHQWNTSLETIESVHLAGVEQVYDIEVEDNHNFVANGLLVHNCHMLSSAAFNALLKTLEEPPDRVVFVLATTDPQRVLPTIISRCQRFDFRRIPLEPMVQHLRMIAEKESISIAQDALHLVAQISQGGLRDAESLLDQLSLLAGEATVDRVWDLVGAVPEQDLMALVEAIATSNPESVLDHTRRLMDRGREPLIVLQNLASFYRDLLIAKTAPTRSDLVAITPPTWTKLCNFAQAQDLGTILVGQQHLRSSELQLKNTTQPRLWLELTLLGLLPTTIVGQPMESSLPQSAIAPTILEAPVFKPVVREITSAPQPLSEPVIVPRVAEVSAPPPSEPGDELAQTWQKILSYIDIPSTKGIVSANCHLLAVSGNDVTVGVRAESMIKMIQRMVPQIGKASAKALRRAVKVTLQVSEVVPSNSAWSIEQPNPSSRLSEVSQQPPEAPAIVPEASESLELTPLAQQEAVENSDHAQASWEDDEVTKAVKSLAYAFNGDVVNLDDDLGVSIDSESITIIPPVAETFEPEEELEEDDEEEVDF